MKKGSFSNCTTKMGTTFSVREGAGPNILYYSPFIKILYVLLVISDNLFIYQVIMSSATHLYFDTPQEPDSEERGLLWATDYTDTYKVFSYMPYKLYDNIDYDHDGLTSNMTKDMMCHTEITCTELTKTQNIIGKELFNIYDWGDS